MNTLRTPRLTRLPQTAAHADAMFGVLGDPPHDDHRDLPEGAISIA